eukprot:7342986-Prymnesium_polylepis.1
MKTSVTRKRQKRRYAGEGIHVTDGMTPQRGTSFTFSPRFSKLFGTLAVPWVEDGRPLPTGLQTLVFKHLCLRAYARFTQRNTRVQVLRHATLIQDHLVECGQAHERRERREVGDARP